MWVQYKKYSDPDRPVAPEGCDADGSGVDGDDNRGRFSSADESCVDGRFSSADESSVNGNNGDCFSSDDESSDEKESDDLSLFGDIANMTSL